MPKPVRHTFKPCQRGHHGSCAAEHYEGRFRSVCDCPCHLQLTLPLKTDVEEFPPLPPELAELLPFMGRQENGVPKGLTRCKVCRDWKGQCLGNNPLYWHEGLIQVRCRCKLTRCKRCGEPFYHHEPCSNYYDVETGEIPHVPYFVAYAHQCDRSDLGG